MNQKFEIKYLRALNRAITNPDKIRRKYNVFSWTLISLGFGFGFGLQIYSEFNPEFELHMGWFVLVGCGLGFGWCLNMCSRGFPYLAEHVNTQSINSRLSEIDT
jgi:hypothetical protein